VRAAGRITLSKNPWSEGLRQECLHLDLIFTNQGAKRGVIEDVAVSIQGLGARAFFRSLAMVSDRTLKLQKELVPPTVETFISFELGQGESTVRRVLWVPHASSIDFSFQATTYTGTLWVCHSGSKKWMRSATFAFTVDREDLTELAKSTATPQPNGGYFVKWLTRDKVLNQTESKLNELQLKLSREGR